MDNSNNNNINNNINNNNNSNNNIEKRFQIKLDKGPLLNEKGEIIQCGYSTKFVKEYDRKDIKSSKWRIKEWDYYFISNGKIGLALTFGDIGYIGNASITFFNFDESSPSYTTKGDLAIFPFGKFQFPKTPLEGSVEYNSKKIQLKFENNGDGIRRLFCKYPNFNSNGDDIECNITLSEFPNDSMVIVTPFKYNQHAFYYNCKINNMVASGEIKIGKDIFNFNSNDSLAVLDWGRGVWPYSEVWYWGSLSCYLDDGRKFGFNIGYGFGDTKNASENMIFLDGVAHKLDEIEFIIPKKNGKEDYMSNWKFTTNDKRLEMNFKPIINRSDNQNYLIIQSCANQVFGLFSGIAILDDGTSIEFNDKLGFAEKVSNKW